MAPANEPQSPRFTLTVEGETWPVDLATFAVENDLDAADLNEIGRMLPGADLHFGGGSVPVVILSRVG